MNWQEGVSCELPYADDFVLMSEAIEGLRNKLRKWKEAYENKGMKVNLLKNRSDGQRKHC